MGFWYSVVIICIIMAIAGVLITYIERNSPKSGNGKNNKAIEKAIKEAKDEIIAEIKNIAIPVNNTENKKEETTRNKES